jgi:hypothetical protein
MTAPVVIPPVRPGPSGSQRSGSMSGFVNLAADLDTNFAAFRTWATAVRANMVMQTFPAANWITQAAGWGAPITAESVAKKLGRLALVSLVITYTGTVTSSATGDVNPDLLVATITEAKLRPVVPVYLSVSCYTGVSVVASLRVDVDGKIYLTGLSAAITATNPGFAMTASWVTAA